MNLKDLKELIELVKSTEVAELEWERSGVRVRIRRGESPGVRSVSPDALVRASTPPIDTRPPATPSEQAESSGVVIRSPIVGTFYRAASPDAPPYVEVGDHVRRGQILCIVEAMKLLNEIECEVDGSVAEIFVDNARPVEYGEALFRIEPA